MATSFADKIFALNFFSQLGELEDPKMAPAALVTIANVVREGLTDEDRKDLMDELNKSGANDYRTLLWVKLHDLLVIHVAARMAQGDPAFAPIADFNFDDPDGDALWFRDLSDCLDDTDLVYALAWLTGQTKSKTGLHAVAKLDKSFRDATRELFENE